MAGRKKEIIYHHAIAAKIKELVKAKVKIDHIISYLIKNYENPPTNQTMLHRIYGDDIKAARAEATKEIGERVYNQAKEGHFPSQEMYLTTLDDWSKKERIEHDLADDEDNSAVGKILAMLGKEPKS